MKLRKKSLVILVCVVFLCSAALIFPREEKPCCLCHSFRYHAPCLVDLETGELIELELYFPHEIQVAELADPQPEQSTFSFIRLGDVEGTKLTGDKTAQFTVPRSQRTANPALCRECRKQVSGLFPRRYALADLYDKEEKILIPIRSGLSTQLHCYEIAVKKGNNRMFDVTIQGNWE